MSLSEATSLCHSNLQIHPYNADNDLKELQQLVKACKRFSPQAGIECVRDHFFRTGTTATDQQPQALFIDITRSVSLFSNERELARQAILDFQRQGYHIRLAIAATLGTAWALAHFAPLQEPPGTGSWFHSFTGNTNHGYSNDSQGWILPSQHTWDGLGTLPPTALRLPLRALQRLQQAGITQISTLYQLPRADLQIRLGKTLLQRLDQALGQQEESIDVYHPPTAFTVEQWLEHPTNNQRRIEWLLTDLLKSLTQSLSQHQQGILQLECHLQCVDKTHLQTTISLFAATTDPEHLGSLLKMQWSHKFLSSPAQQIKLSAVRTAPLESYQQSLLNHSEAKSSLAPRDLPVPFQQTRSRRLAHLIDRLNRRLGADRVLQAHLQADAQPERAYYTTSWITYDSPQKRGTATSCPKSYSPGTSTTRPLQLLTPAPHLTVTSVAFDGSPIDFSYRTHAYHVEQAWGPERIETGWWRGPSVRRDYYRVQTTTGHRLWLFLDLQQNNWHLHGYFS